MFGFIAATIEHLRSKANEWYVWLWPEEDWAESEQPVPPAEPPAAVAPTQPVLPLSDSAPKQPRDAIKSKAATTSGQAQPPPYKSLEVSKKPDYARRVPVVEPNTFTARGKNLEYLIGRIGSNVRRRFFENRIVGFTGRLPYEPRDIETFIRRLGGTPGFDGLWQPSQLMIIGREGFDRTYLKHSVEAGMQNGFECIYISQEALTGLLRLSTLPGYYRGDTRIRDHAGLQCVADFGFIWPTTNVSEPSNGTGEEHSAAWRPSHELTEIYGYRVDERTGLTIAERQERLRRAVAGLGLRCVAEHIAANIKLAKNRRNANMESAIEKWHDDLDWLHETFYKGSIHRFIWPHVFRSRRKAS